MSSVSTSWYFFVKINYDPKKIDQVNFTYRIINEVVAMAVLKQSIRNILPGVVKEQIQFFFQKLLCIENQEKPQEEHECIHFYKTYSSSNRFHLFIFIFLIGNFIKRYVIDVYNTNNLHLSVLLFFFKQPVTCI